MAGLIVPIEEEILYRRVIYGWLRSWTPKVPALLLSAAIFPGMHAELGDMNVFLAFLLGLLAAWLYERSGSIIPAVASMPPGTRQRP